MNENLVKAFHDAALFLRERVRHDGWHWSSNFLREYVRASTDTGFTNTLSPEILREVIRRDPSLKNWITLGPLKKRAR